MTLEQAIAVGMFLGICIAMLCIVWEAIERKIK